MLNMDGLDLLCAIVLLVWFSVYLFQILRAGRVLLYRHGVEMGRAGQADTIAIMRDPHSGYWVTLNRSHKIFRETLWGARRAARQIKRRIALPEEVETL